MVCFYVDLWYGVIVCLIGWMVVVLWIVIIGVVDLCVGKRGIGVLNIDKMLLMFFVVWCVVDVG